MPVRHINFAVCAALDHADARGVSVIALAGHRYAHPPQAWHTDCVKSGFPSQRPMHRSGKNGRRRGSPAFVRIVSRV
jgi:hypothetical protein